MRAVTTPFAATRVRRRRWVRRVIIAVLGLLVLAAAGFGLLLAVTPSVSDAEARTQQLAAAHGVADTAAVGALDVRGRLWWPPRTAGSTPTTGVDTPGALRAVAGFLGRSAGSGGATLDQQLAKMLYVDGQRSTDQVQEVALALKLDASYAKPEILQMYAQTAYFGNQAYGLDAASCRYFGEPAAALGWGQASLLAGLVGRPPPTTRSSTPGSPAHARATCSTGWSSPGPSRRPRRPRASSAPWRLVDPAQDPWCRG